MKTNDVIFVVVVMTSIGFFCYLGFISNSKNNQSICRTTGPLKIVTMDAKEGNLGNVTFGVESYKDPQLEICIDSKGNKTLGWTGTPVH